MNLPLLDADIFYELQISDQRPADLLEEAVAFEGSLRLHYNPGLVLLLLNPLEPNSTLFEFRVGDILYAEQLASISRENGVTVERVRLWVRRGSPAVKMQPLRVDEHLAEEKTR